MKKYIVEINTANKFQPANTTPVAKVEAKSKKAAVEAYRFYLKSGLSPVDAVVEPLDQGNYSWNCAFSAYEEV